MEVKQLSPANWEIWKSFRLEALMDAPESFGSSFEEEVTWSDSDWRNSLTKSDIFGVFVDNGLVCCAGFYSLHSSKTKHRGVIWGMYTRPQYRGQRSASTLMQTLITHARERVSQIHLTCVSSNLKGLAFYKRHGFQIYGTEPNALKIGTEFFDEHLMVLNLSVKPMQEPNIERSSVPKAEDIDFLTEKINQETPDFGEAFPYGFFIRDDQDQIIAGCNGSVVFGNIYTDQLWVDPKHRGQGLAKRLMHQVHYYGKEQGCTMASVNTMTFQNAKKFYEKLRYKVEFERSGYTQNSSCIFLKRIL